METYKILIVDDDPDIIEAVTETLSMGLKDIINVEFKTAFDGMEAFKLLQEETIDLVVIDLRMPRMDGLSTIKKNRKESKINSQVPFIILSGYLKDLKSFTEPSILDGVYLLDKPVEGVHLIDVIKRKLNLIGDIDDVRSET